MFTLGGDVGAVEKRLFEATAAAAVAVATRAVRSF